MQVFKLFTLTLLSRLNGSLSERLPVCVVGAGPSGITVARNLKSNGIDHRVFEGDVRVGGKAYTWRDEANFGVEVGAFFFVRRDDSINRAIRDAGLNLSWFDGSSMQVYNQKGNFKELPMDSDSEKLKFVEAVNRYTQLRQEYNLTVGYVDIPEDAQVSLSQWLYNNKLDVLRSFFVPNIVLQGYGSLEDIPAIYVIKAFDLRGLSCFQQFGYALWSVKEGLDKLWGNLSKDLNLSVNHKVSLIQRDATLNGKHEINLHFEDASLKPVACSYVVLAFPPYLLKIKSMIPDLDENEENVISKFRNNHYSTSIVEKEGRAWNSRAVFNLLSDDEAFPYEPLGKGEVVALLKQGKYHTAYSWQRGDYFGPAPNSTLTSFRSHRNQLLQRINTRIAGNFKTHFEKSFAYFPHVPVVDIQQGFFKKFDQMQGYKNTFYATNALSFETMNESIEMAQSLFETKIFPQIQKSKLQHPMSKVLFVDQTHRRGPIQK